MPSDPFLDEVFGCPLRPEVIARSALDAALEYARAGWPVLPLKSGDKKPLIREWQHLATVDAAQIKAWWAEFRGDRGRCIFGIQIASAGLVVIDEDANHGDGKDGVKNMSDYEALPDKKLPDTLTIKSPSGGRHRYYRTGTPLKRKRTNGEFLPRVDILGGSNSYAVIAGCRNAAGGTYELVKALPVATLPDWFMEEVNSTVSDAPGGLPAGFDFVPDSVDEVLSIVLDIERMEPITEYRDNTLAQLALKWKDHGISAAGIVRLFEHLNESGKLEQTPGDPKDRKDFLRIASSAYRNGRNPAGCRTLDAMLGGEKAQYTASELSRMVLPELEETIKGFALPGLGLLAGPPKMGKSFLVLQMCHAVATGAMFLGKETKKGPVLYLALEDSPRRMRKRLRAMFGDEYATHNLIIRHVCPVFDAEGLAALVRLIEDLQPCMVVIDTWQKVRTAPSGRSVNAYAQDYADASAVKRIADAFDIPIWLVLHFKKRCQGDASDVVESINGSSGITGAADTIVILRRERGAETADLFVTGRDVDDAAIEMVKREGGGWAVAETSRRGHIKAHTEQQEKVLSVLDAHPELVKADLIVKETALPLSTVKSTLKRWYDAGLLYREKGAYGLVRVEEKDSFHEEKMQ